MSSIEVCIRMRPFLPSEQQADRQRIIMQEGQVKYNLSYFRVDLTEHKQKVFGFNHVLDRQTHQGELYSRIGVQKLVERVVEGYHSTIFAYGQTGSGKTYTIEGGEGNDEGIIPRAIKDVFRLINGQGDGQRGFRVYLSFMQIYNQAIYDLIDPGDGRALRMRWNKHQQFTVQNLFECQCRNAEQAVGWWKRGQRNKVMGTHKMNNASSRSHCILTLKLQNFSLQDPSHLIESRLEIVDLAGSERYKATRSQGVVFKEGIQINKSLFTLRQVIASLYQSSTTGRTGIVPPYRDSKLTSLLKQSIGGNSFCLMIACLNPSATHFQQSLQTLTYASMASYINNAPTLNVDPKVKQNQQLRQQIILLNGEIKKLQEHIKLLTGMVENNICIDCRRRKESGEDGLEAKQPLGIVSLPKINQKIIQQQTNFQELHNINKEYLSIQTPNHSQISAKRTLSSTKEIIQSIGMIRDLISSNSFLREKIQFYKEFIENQQKEMFALMKENQNLRDHQSLPAIHSNHANTYNSHNINKTNKTQPTSLAEFATDVKKIDAYRMRTYGQDSPQTRKSKLQLQSQSRNKMSYNDFLKARNEHHRKNKKRLHSQYKKDSNSFLF